MILKGNARANGQNLASHLLNQRDNDRVDVAEMRGFVGDDLHRAFAEAEAISRATNCDKFLYSCSINPSQEMSRDDYLRAVDAIEAKLGFVGQPRACVFHVKDGREHCHVVWSRIDAENLKAIHLPFDRQNLREVARDLCHELGHKMPPHLEFDRGADRFQDRDKTQAEIEQEKRTSHSKEDRQRIITDAYRRADTGKAFRAALADSGFVIARGDRRAFVVIDRAGEIHSLNRQIAGVKAKDIKAKLKLDAMDIPSIHDAQKELATKAREQAAHSQFKSAASQDQKSIRSAQERARDAAEAFQRANDLLTKLHQAHQAELKAERARHRKAAAELKSSATAELEDIPRTVKEDFRQHWRDLYRRHRFEQAAVKEMTATPTARLKALLSGRAGDVFTDINRGKLAAMMRFVVRGQDAANKLDKAQAKEKKALGDEQRIVLKQRYAAAKEAQKSAREKLQTRHADRMADLDMHFRHDMVEAWKARDLLDQQAAQAMQDLKEREQEAERESEKPYWQREKDAARSFNTKNDANHQEEQERERQKGRDDGFDFEL